MSKTSLMRLSDFLASMIIFVRKFNVKTNYTNYCILKTTKLYLL